MRGIQFNLKISNNKEEVVLENVVRLSLLKLSKHSLSLIFDNFEQFIVVVVNRILLSLQRSCGSCRVESKT